MCQAVKAAKKSGGSTKMKKVYKQRLTELNRVCHRQLALPAAPASHTPTLLRPLQALPESFVLPIDPKMEVKSIIVEEVCVCVCVCLSVVTLAVSLPACLPATLTHLLRYPPSSAVLLPQCKVMSSAKLPLWLVFENADPDGDKILVMFKAGDDLRQDTVTLQLIKVMDAIWRAEGLDLRLSPYRCLSTWHDGGMLEIVRNSVSGECQGLYLYTRCCCCCCC